MILRARSVSAPMTTRSGFMKSSIAAPSLRNSGLETTSNACLVDRGDLRADLVRGAHRHGALVDDDRVAASSPGRSAAAAASTYCRSASPLSPSGGADGDEDHLAPAHRVGEIGGEGEAALLDVAFATSSSRPGS